VHGIAEQVDQDLAHLVGLDPDRRQIGRGLQIHCEVLVASLAGQQLQGFAGQFGQIDLGQTAWAAMGRVATKAF
jgi:hypothetical protein